LGKSNGLKREISWGVDCCDGERDYVTGCLKNGRGGIAHEKKEGVSVIGRLKGVVAGGESLGACPTRIFGVESMKRRRRHRKVQ